MSIDKTFSQLPSFTITSEKQIKAYTHHLRMRIMAYLCKQKMTITQIASRIGVHQANITHHFRKLEEVGLIKLVEKRDIGRTTEKYYSAVAKHFTVKPTYKHLANQNEVVLSLLRDNLSFAIDTLESDEPEAIVGLLMNINIKPELMPRFKKKLYQLIKEFKGYNSAKGQPYSLNVSLYPCEDVYPPSTKVHIGSE